MLARSASDQALEPLDREVLLFDDRDERKQEAEQTIDERQVSFGGRTRAHTLAQGLNLAAARRRYVVTLADREPPPEETIG